MSIQTAVILAAGRGIRLGPLGRTIPKGCSDVVDSDQAHLVRCQPAAPGRALATGLASDAAGRAFPPDRHLAPAAILTPTGTLRGRVRSAAWKPEPRTNRRTSERCCGGSPVPPDSPKSSSPSGLD